MYRRVFTLALIAAAIWLVSATASAACGAEERLINEEPYDLLTIPDGKETKTLKVYPVKLPNRRLPKDPKPTATIKVRLLEDDETRDFEVMWRDVKKLEFFEDRVLAEAETLAVAQQFDDAYDDYAYLLKNYPNTQGLDASIQSYWYLSAGAAFREKRYDEALSVLEELLKKNPGFRLSETSPSLMRVLGEICDKLVQGYLDKGDFRSARQMIDRITKSYPDSKQEPFYSKFQQRMQTAAEKRRDEARENLEAKRYTQAYDATAAMLDILPEVEGGRELAAQIAREYPLVIVAVEQLATNPNALRIDRWAELRAGRLTDRRLTELRGIGPEGGDYACPLGTCERSEDGRNLTVTLRGQNSSFRTYDVLQLLLASARPDSGSFSADWAQVFGAARIVKPNQVEATLSRSHVLPQALLELPLVFPQAGTEKLVWPGNYEVSAGDATRSRYVLPADSPRAEGQPREVQERVYPSPEAAILALQRGEIELMDRVQPADLANVRAIAGVTVGSYAVPTLSVLVPNAERPFSNSRTFRRAVMYGLQREAILRQGILHEQNVSTANDQPPAGGQLISGPFPAPQTPNDPLAYAYDNTIKPHAYEPLLAVTLVELAKREVQAAARLKNEELPKFEGIVIGHLPLELHRIACKAMAKQLSSIGIGCKNLELADEAAAKQCDFVYTDLLVTEPVIDADRLFGPTGLFPVSNPHVRLGVRMVGQATTWNQAGQRLRQLHRTLHEDLTVLPLWQTVEHFAVRTNVRGVNPNSVSLYQDIDHWQVASRLGQN